MKKIIFSFLIIYLFSLVIVLGTHAQTSSPSSNTILDELKDKIASRVAQLKLVENKGILGKVTDVSDTQITIADISNNTRFIDVDELTKFIPSSSSVQSFGISDIKKGDTLGILGIYNKQSRRILARAIYEESLPEMIHGNIANIDSDNYVLTIATDDNNQFEVSIEDTTRTFSYDSSSQNLIRSGFSKLKLGEKIFVRGNLDPKNDKSISADAIIVFPDIIKGGLTPEISPSVVPSTGSGKKLTPITR